MEINESNLIKKTFLAELSKMLPQESKSSLEKISKYFEIEYTKKDIAIPEKESMKHCNLDFEINLINNKNKPCSNHLIGHIIVGGLRVKGMPMKKNINDLWKCNLGICFLNDIGLCRLISYNFSIHLNEDTFSQACKKANLNLERQNFDDREIVQYAFYHKGMELTK